MLPHINFSDYIDPKEMCELLKRLIQIPSINGDETKVAEEIIRILEREGIETYELIESAPGRGNLIIDIRGKRGNGFNLMIIGHADVVPAGEGWTVPPFAGIERNGWIYGRGAFDNKGQVTVMVYLAILLHRLGLDFKGKVRLLIAADEETQHPNHGVRYLIKHRPDVFKGIHGAIGELGGLVRINNKEFQMIIFGEKSSATYDIIVVGEGKHSSTPYGVKNPIDSLAKILLRIPDGVFFISNPVKKALKKTLGFYSYFLTNRITNKLIIKLIEKKNKELARSLHALTHITIAKTMVYGGTAENVIPREAKATVDLRGFPEQNEKDLRKIITKYCRGIEIRLRTYIPSTYTNPENSLLHNAICDVIRTLKYEPLPVFMTGTSDSAWLRKLGIPVFHFFVTKHTIDCFNPHMADEKIHIDDLMLALQGYYYLIMKLS